MAGVVSVCMADRGVAQVTTTIFFDGVGAEDGITEPGTTDFSFAGSNWTGGIVATEGSPPLYASGSFSYEIPSGTATVTFDEPIDSVDFFYVHGFGFNEGDAVALDADSNILGIVSSNLATNFGAPANFESLDPSTPIASIEFSAGVVDNFTFTTVPEPATLGLLASGGLALSRRNRRA